MSAELSPIDELKKEILDLETERETIYQRFTSIELELGEKRKRLDVWNKMSGNQSIRDKMIKQMKLCKWIKDETLKDETPKDETPKDETPKDETPKDETPKDETPKDETVNTPKN